MRRGIARLKENCEFLYAVGVDVAVEVGAEGAEQDEKVDDIHGSVAVEFACTDRKRPTLRYLKVCHARWLIYRHGNMLHCMLSNVSW